MTAALRPRMRTFLSLLLPFALLPSVFAGRGRKPERPSDRSRRPRRRQCRSDRQRAPRRRRCARAPTPTASSSSPVSTRAATRHASAPGLVSDALAIDVAERAGDARHHAARQRRQRNADRLGGADRSAAVAHARQRHGDPRPRDRGASSSSRSARRCARCPASPCSRTADPGTVTSLFTRGGESDFTLVLVDGVRANAFGGGLDLSQVPLQDVERIEVVRGPQSALYGSDAIGGVVQIITRSGGPPSAQAQIEGGSRDMRRAAGATTGEVNGVRWQARRELLRGRGLHRHGAPTARP